MGGHGALPSAGPVRMGPHVESSAGLHTLRRCRQDEGAHSSWRRTPTSPPLSESDSGGHLSPPAGRPRWGEVRRVRHDRNRGPPAGPVMKVTVDHPTCDEGLRPERRRSRCRTRHGCGRSGRARRECRGRAATGRGLRVASLHWSPPSDRRADGQRRAAARGSWPGSSRRSPSTCTTRRSPLVRSGSVRQTCCRPRRRAHHHLRAGHPRRHRTCDLHADGSALRGRSRHIHPHRGAARGPPKPLASHFSSKTSSRADSARVPEVIGEHNCRREGARTRRPTATCRRPMDRGPLPGTTPPAQAWEDPTGSRPVSPLDAVRSPPCLHLPRVGTTAPCSVKYLF